MDKDKKPESINDDKKTRSVWGLPTKWNINSMAY